MTPEEIRAEMRAKMDAIGLSLTEQGERSMRREQKKLRQQAHEAIDRLTPIDLFPVWLIAMELARPDKPVAAPAKNGSKKARARQ